METIKILRKKHIIPKDVVMLKGDINYTEVIFQNGNKLIVAKTLKRLNDTFSEFGFFRVNKSNIINIRFLTNTYENFSVVKLKNNIELNVSRRRREDLKAFIYASQQ